MLTMVDEAVWGAPGLFEPFGTVRTFRGRSVRPADCASADALVVRSVTRVDAALLAGSAVRFVGTTTSGTDHVDTDWLEARGISFASAAGSNAAAVAEYVLAAILLLAERRGFDPGDKTLGVIGRGRIGSRVANWGRALGLRVLACDPPLQRRTGDAAFVGFPELARRSDIVTLHVSLTRSGQDATWGMVDARWLSSLKTGAILINTARGEVVREADLLAAIAAGRLGGVVSDVWRGEPDVHRTLVDRVTIATPHIAGHTAEAKRRAAEMIRDALVAFAGAPYPADARDETASVDVVLDETAPSVAAGTPAMPTWRRAVGRIVRQACDVAAMDTAFRQAVCRPSGGVGFDDLRRKFSVRREFASHRVTAPSLDAAALRFLTHVGFRTAP